MAADLAEFGNVAPSPIARGSFLPSGAAGGGVVVFAHLHILAQFPEVCFEEVVRRRMAILQVSGRAALRWTSHWSTWFRLAP